MGQNRVVSNDEKAVTKTILDHEFAEVVVSELSAGKRKIVVKRKDPNYYVRFNHIETAYPVKLIEQIFEAKGPGWLCDEISREESSGYAGSALRLRLQSYVDATEFEGARILDFGCGSGASTVCLSRMFPSAQLVGIELEKSLLAIARTRASFYQLQNIEYYLSPDPETLPDTIGSFDYIVMTGVFEHLFLNERNTLLPQLWSKLKPGGVIFIHDTPYRHFPIETHTTGGLPLLNYLPKALALPYARRVSRRNLSQDSWETMQRKGIIGGSCSEILGILGASEYKPILMAPSKLGVTNRIDLWYLSSEKSQFGAAKKAIRFFMGLIRKLTKIEMVPYLELAIRKSAIQK